MFRTVELTLFKGVLLLEIGYWKYILKMDNFQDAAEPEEAREILVRRAGNDLAHIMGTSYSRVVLYCLTENIEGGGYSRERFESEVISRLAFLAEQTE
jgi:hypothetical protein